MADATKLTVPVAVLVSAAIMVGGGTYWFAGLTGGIATLSDRMGRLESRLAGVEANTNASINQQTNAGQTTAILAERQAAQTERLNDIAGRMLRLEDWQRAVNARPAP